MKADVEAAEPSATAKRTAVRRGQHRLLDQRPWILDDPFALMLVGPQWPEIATAPSVLLREPIVREGRAWVVARARYAEDRLCDGRFDQYVILGAGLDSFAWTRPDLLRALRVFEVDHPATQKWKQHRVDVLALPTDVRHIFVPVDFERETLRDGLDAAGLNWSLTR